MGNSRSEFLDLVNGTKEKYLELVQDAKQISIRVIGGITLNKCKILVGEQEYALCLFKNSKYKGAFFLSALLNVLVEDGKVTLVLEETFLLEPR